MLSTRVIGKVVVVAEVAEVVVVEVEVVLEVVEAVATETIITVEVVMTDATEVVVEETGGVQIQNAVTQTSLGETSVIFAKV